MPQLNPLYVLMPPLQQVIHDVNDGTLLTYGIVTFYRDSARTELKSVYQLSRSPSNEYIYTELSNPLRLSGIGSYVDENGNNIIPYLKPYDENGDVDLYYITVESSGGVEQFNLEAWPNTLFADGGDLFDSSGNQIENPQFAEVSFTEDPTTGQHVYSLSGSNTETQIAPGWFMVTSGTGTVTVEQFEVVDTGAVTNPPYALDITSAGISSISLHQRFYNSPRLFVGSFVNGSVAVNSQNGSSSDITMSYVPSSGTSYVIFAGEVAASATFQQISDVVQIIGGTINTDPASTGYVDIVISIDVGAHIQLTSIQFLSVFSENSNLPFIQETVPRQTDYLFSYYKDSLIAKQVPNVLTAWDFTNNPAQFGGSSQTISVNAATGNAEYIWDSTICGRAGGNYTVTRNTVGQGFQAVSTVAQTSFFMMQYLTQDDIANIRTLPISINVNARKGATGAVNLKVYLFRAPSTSTIPTLPNGIGTMNASGEFTLTASGWTEVPRSNQGLATATVTTGETDADYGFNQWQITDAGQLANTSYFAVVVTFSTTVIGTTVVVDSINLVNGNLPCRPAPESATDVLNQCQYFYEKSYPDTSAPDSIIITGSVLVPTFYSQNVITSGYVSSFSFPFVTKRLPLVFSGGSKNITFYAPQIAGANQVAIRVFVDGSAQAAGVTAGTGVTLVSAGTGNGYFTFSTFLSGSGSSNQRCTILSIDTTTAAITATGVNSEVFLQFHYVIDQRLGVV